MNNLKKIVLFLTLLTIEQLSFGRALTETKDEYQAIINHLNENGFNSNAIQQKNANLQELENTIKTDIESSIVPAEAAPIILNTLIKDPINSSIKMPLEQMFKNLETEGFFISKVNEYNYLYSKQAKNMNPTETAAFNADRLIEESFISPADQWAVLSFFKKPFIINVKTGSPVVLDKPNGKVQNWFTVQQIIENAKWTRISLTQKIDTINALQATLNAIAIATEVAKLEAGYDATKQNFYLYQSADQKITQVLNNKKDTVQKILERVQNANTSGSDEVFYYVTTHLNNPDYLMLSANEMQDISAKYDYKALVEQGNIENAAQLLFKQCFIAQQHHLKDVNLLNADMISIDMSQGTYIYDSFPSMDSLRSFVKNMNTGKPEKHNMLSHIRQAVQTARFIANKNSTYYVTTDPLVAALDDMDKEIKADWINPVYGAGKEDQNRQAMWDNLNFAKNTALVLGGSAVALGAGYAAYANQDIIKGNVYDALNTTQQVIKDLPNQVYNAGEKIVTNLTDTLDDQLAKISSVEGRIELLNKREIAVEKDLDQLNAQMKKAKTADQKASIAEQIAYKKQALTDTKNNITKAEQEKIYKDSTKDIKKYEKAKDDGTATFGVTDFQLRLAQNRQASALEKKKSIESKQQESKTPKPENQNQANIEKDVNALVNRLGVPAPVATQKSYDGYLI